MRTHTREKVSQCAICSKIFTDSSGLRRHMQIHSGQKNYQCAVCKKSFVRKSGLDSHQIIHTGVRAYQCSVCPKQFTHKSNLGKHMKLHVTAMSAADIAQLTAVANVDKENTDQNRQLQDSTPGDQHVNNPKPCHWNVSSVEKYVRDKVSLLFICDLTQTRNHTHVRSAARRLHVQRM